MPEGPPIDCSTLDVMPSRGRIRAAGYVENIKILPASEAPAYSASVVDAPAPPGGRRRPVPRVRLVWLGQRRVPGVFAGTWLRFEGTVAPVDGIPTIFNPRYEILPEHDEPETQA